MANRIVPPMKTIGISVLMLLVHVGAAAEPRTVADQIRPGMTADTVRGVMGGPPKRIARQILYRRHLELWTYETPVPLWIEFTCIRGREPCVSAIHREIP